MKKIRIDSSDAAKKLSSEELAAYKILSDPVKWAHATLKNPAKPDEPLRLRWYQKEVLRAKDKKKVIRMGRRTGKTVALCVEILWYSFTNKMKEILIVCPYKSQVGVVFTSLNRLIGDSEVLKESISSNKTNPYEIKFRNGTVISGFTAGTRSGQKGAQIRGQSANRIYLDEVDYMGDEAIVAVMAIILTSPDTTIWGSSTPTGKRESFYNWCTNRSLGFREFHYSACEVPSWNAEMEYFLKNTTTEHEYEHEYLAEFGEEVVGVFQNSHVDKCLRDYHYTKGTYYNSDGKKLQHSGIAGEYNPNNIYGIGVDWNSAGNGVQIVVVEYCLHPPPDKKYLINKFRIFNRFEVISKEFTQTLAVEKIREANLLYNPDFIYVDEGYGAHQIEALHKIGMEHPETGLLKKVVPINFSSKVKVADPGTKKYSDKPMKAFMVNNAVSYVEQRILCLPEFEDEKIKLVGQMRAYTVERMSQTGIPVYSKGNDHILDGLMLALLGFTMELSNLGKIRANNKVVEHHSFVRKLLARSGVNERWQVSDENKDEPLAPERTPRLTDIAEAHGFTSEYTRDSDRGKFDKGWGDPHRNSNMTRQGFRKVRRNLGNTPQMPMRTGTLLKRAGRGTL